MKISNKVLDEGADRVYKKKCMSQAWIDRTLDNIAHSCVVVAGILLVLLIVSFGWLVFGRYVLNDTPTWVEQFALLSVAYITCLGAAAGVRNNSHLSIDLLRDNMPEPFRTLMHHVADLIVTIFGAIMAWQGLILLLSNNSRPIPMLGLMESWRFAPLVICGVLMVLFSLASIVKRHNAHLPTDKEV